MMKKKTLAGITAAVLTAGLAIASCDMGGTADQNGTSRSVAAGSKVLLSYTVLDGGYKNGSLMKITGEEDASSSSLGTIDNPANSGITFDSSLSDPVVFSFVNSNALRELLVKIQTSGAVSSCTVSLIDPTSANWSSLTGDMTLQYDSETVLFNPHGVAQSGNMLYFIDYESQQIVLLGTNELSSQTTGNLSLLNEPFDLTSVLDDANAKGQAVIAIGNYLYALYIVNDEVGATYRPSILVRLAIGAGGALTYDTQTTAGLNATEIVPVTSGGATTLLIPAIGGYQNGGSTNGTLSSICAVPAVGAWSASAPVLVTGDDPSTANHSYDIRAVATSSQNSSTAPVYILAATYTSSYTTSNYRLYQTTVSGILTPAGGTLSTAGFTVAEADDSAGLPGYFWDVLYENGSPTGADRLWFLRGSPILVTLAASYGIPRDYFDVGTGAGQIGGQNINSVDLTSETLNQFAAGVSLKRGFRLDRASREKHWNWR